MAIETVELTSTRPASEFLQSTFRIDDDTPFRVTRFHLKLTSRRVPLESFVSHTEVDAEADAATTSAQAGHRVFGVKLLREAEFWHGDFVSVNGKRSVPP